MGLFKDDAAAVKLFVSLYLALCVSCFNERDAYCGVKRFPKRNIIKGDYLDSRVGDFYINPPFGFGGYCLPKDFKQFLANCRDAPRNLIEIT